MPLPPSPSPFEVWCLAKHCPGRSCSHHPPGGLCACLALPWPGLVHVLASLKMTKPGPGPVPNLAMWKMTTSWPNLGPVPDQPKEPKYFPGQNIIYANLTQVSWCKNGHDSHSGLRIKSSVNVNLNLSNMPGFQHPVISLNFPISVSSIDH